MPAGVNTSPLNNRDGVTMTLIVGEKRIVGRVTDEAWQGWHDFAARHRVSVAALLQAMGEAFAAGRRVVTAELVERAAQVDQERKFH